MTATALSGDDSTTRSRRASVDLSMEGGLAGAADAARRAQAASCRGIWTAETKSDAFLPAVPAFAATTSLEVGTGIVIAFARSPMTIAQEAVDLQDFSGGRFVLGLGSQIRTHITKRFSMPWGKPVAQMREMIGALRAVFAHWYDGEPLNFVGEYYQLTFNSTAFARRPSHPVPPPIYLASVGPSMTRLAGDAADGFISHSFVTPDYFRDVVLGRLRAGRRAQDDDYEVVITCNAIVDTAETPLEVALERTRAQVALYGSTPAYKVVLDHHGLGDLHRELHRLSRQNRWTEMGQLIDDKTLGLFAVWGEPRAVAEELFDRFGDSATRFRLPSDAVAVAEPLAELTSGR